MKRVIAALAALVLAVVLVSVQPWGGAEARILVFADRTLQPPLEELARMYVEEKALDGVEVNVTFIYGSSGYVLSQLEIQGRGDVYVADDQYFALIGVDRGLLYPRSLETIGYLRLVLVVQEGNPKGITSIQDVLERGDVTIAIGNPEHVSAGVLAKRVLEKAGLWDSVEELVGTGRVVMVKSASEAASYVMLGLVDAAITFNIYVNLNPDKLDIVDDPLLADFKAPVVVALPRGASEAGVDFYRYIIDNAEVFYKYGVEPGKG